VENRQAILADGGKMILTAKAAHELVGAQVNTSGIVQARTLDDLTGNININAYGGTTTIDGTLDASATNGDGGFIETSGDRVTITENALITTYANNGKTGTWLIDPKDFTVGTGGDISGQTLSTQLQNSNIEIQSQNGAKEGKGDININDAITWSADTTLTLSAENDIYINNAITAKGANAGVVLSYGGEYYILTPASYSGAALDENGLPTAKKDTSGGVYGSITFLGSNAKLVINNQQYTLIYDLAQLQAISGIVGNYALTNSLDLKDNPFTASVIALLAADSIFAGLGHTIDNLKITSTSENTGLFATTTTGSLIRDIGLTNVDITSTQQYTGALVGTNLADIDKVYATG
jgi:hypothetical protein